MAEQGSDESAGIRGSSPTQRLVPFDLHSSSILRMNSIVFPPVASQSSLVRRSGSGFASFCRTQTSSIISIRLSSYRYPIFRAFLGMSMYNPIIEGSEGLQEVRRHEKNMRATRGCTPRVSALRPGWRNAARILLRISGWHKHRFGYSSDWRGRFAGKLDTPRIHSGLRDRQIRYRTRSQPSLPTLLLRDPAIQGIRR